MAASTPSLTELVSLAVIAALASAGLILLLRPVLMRYALARPNARSSHKIPTPQGGGIAVIAAMVGVATAAFAIASDIDRGTAWQIAFVFAGVLLLAAAGAVDDIVALGAGPKLLLQLLPVLAVLAALPPDLRIAPGVPWWIERAGLLIAGLWLVNLVNFMDGIDWMTVAEVVPVTAALVLLGLTGDMPMPETIVAACLLGGMIGFAPFNRPVARLFLGDVGSLPIGLVLFWLLVVLAGQGQITAAILLPLYYLADTAITLARRLAAGETITQAHRSHFYQIATERGLTVPAVVGRVFAVNVALVLLALASVWARSPAVDGLALLLGAGLVAWLLVTLKRGSA